jgi:hypothetical protein
MQIQKAVAAWTFSDSLGSERDRKATGEQLSVSTTSSMRLLNVLLFQKKNDKYVDSFRQNAIID